MRRRSYGTGKRPASVGIERASRTTSRRSTIDDGFRRTRRRRKSETRSDGLQLASKHRTSVAYQGSHSARTRHCTVHSSPLKCEHCVCYRSLITFGAAGGEAAQPNSEDPPSEGDREQAAAAERRRHALPEVRTARTQHARAPHAHAHLLHVRAGAEPTQLGAWSTCT